jgi:CxxC-x17-CxxC domain-containing protein
MHTAICAECGVETQVPFRPSGDRPVYCRDCFNASKGY